MSIQHVTVIGCGVLGSQIAYQSAYKGFDVTVYLRSAASVERAHPKLDRLHRIYLEELHAAKNGGPVCDGLVPDINDPASADYNALIEKADNAYTQLRLVTDLAEAVRDADLVIEALAENLQQKLDFFTQMAPLLPEKTIVATNSSTLLPSAMADATGRPENFLALHFANNIWKQNIAEIMGHDRTDPAAYDAVAQFAEDIGMVPMKLHKEKAGYIINSLLVPLLSAAQGLLVDGIADVPTIDKTWMMATCAPLGPFRLLDIVGLTTAYNVCMNHEDTHTDPTCMHARLAKLLKEEYLDKGKLGVIAGEGFYKYD